MTENEKPFDVEAELKGLAEYEKKLLAENEEVKGIISTQSKRFKYIEYEGKKIKIKASIPYDVRKKANAMKLEQESNDLPPEDIVEAQKPMYELLASVCIDSPYTDWRTWYVIDKNGDAGPTMLKEILQTISQSEKQITKFR